MPKIEDAEGNLQKEADETLVNVSLKKKMTKKNIYSNLPIESPTPKIKAGGNLQKESQTKR